MIGGIVVSGANPVRVLVRGNGPTLAGFGVADTVEDPVLEVYRTNPDGSSTLIATNDDWDAETSEGAFAVAAGADGVGAFPLVSGNLDAALVLDLTAGSYTIQLKGKSGEVQNGMIEVYQMGY